MAREKNFWDLVGTFRGDGSDLQRVVDQLQVGRVLYLPADPPQGGWPQGSPEGGGYEVPYAGLACGKQVTILGDGIHAGEKLGLRYRMIPAQGRGIRIAADHVRFADISLSNGLGGPSGNNDGIIADYSIPGTEAFASKVIRQLTLERVRIMYAGRHSAWLGPHDGGAGFITMRLQDGYFFGSGDINAVIFNGHFHKVNNFQAVEGQRGGWRILRTATSDFNFVAEANGVAHNPEDYEVEVDGCLSCSFGLHIEEGNRDRVIKPWIMRNSKCVSVKPPSIVAFYTDRQDHDAVRIENSSACVIEPVGIIGSVKNVVRAVNCSKLEVFMQDAGKVVLDSATRETAIVHAPRKR